MLRGAQRAGGGCTLSPFRLETPASVLTDLERRLDSARWPSPPPGAPWRWGTDPGYLRNLVEHWRERFDWRAWEARLNAYPQYIATLADAEIHLLVEPGSGTAPLPIILTHGWPGSVFELIDLVETLAHPERGGGVVDDAFTVVLPSLPGFGFSPAPARILTPRDVAGLWHVLMTEGLGFERYVAHGGDTGAAVTSWLGLRRSDAVPAIHLNTAVLQADWSFAANPPDAEEAAYLDRQAARLAGEDAYQHLHAEKPATLAYGLRDSPIGLAAWIAEKFHGWTDTTDPSVAAFPFEPLIANIMAYWVGALEPVHWMYQPLRDFSGYRLPAGQRVATPAGFCLFPNDIVVPPPRRWLQRAYTVAALNIAPRGGHFPGMENSALLADDIRGFFRAFR